MSREIKFRAWDKELNKMFEVTQLDFSDWWVQCKKPTDAPKENGGAFYGERNSFKNEQTDRHLLMQYTGLKDNKRNQEFPNGQEIYEGDIVNLILKGSCSEFATKEDETEKSYIGEVYFNNGYCVKTDNYCPSITNYLSTSIEVIGNIYQNTELLQNQE